MQKSKLINKDIIKGSLTGIITLVLSIVIAATTILKTMPHNKYYLPIFTLCLIFSGLTSGFSASFIQRKNGLINGCAASLLSAVISFIAVNLAEDSINPINIIVPVIIILSGAAGGITAANIKVKRKRR